MNNNHKNDILSNEKALQVLKALEQDLQITQRDLARKLDVSLRKTNFLLNAFIDKGIIEARNFKNSKSKMAYMYLFTPQGIKIKIELAHQFFISKTREYNQLEKELEGLRKEILPLMESLKKD